MKKIFTVLAILLFTGAAQAQFTVAPNPVYTGGAPSTVLICKAFFKNTALTGDSFTWVRFQNLPSGWSSQICDVITCWGDAKDSSSFYMAAGDSNIIDVNISPNNNPGHTLVKLYIYQKGNRAGGDTVYYYANAFANGTPKMSTSKEFVFYPNPAQDVLTFRYDAKSGARIDIFNIIGNKVKTVNHTGYTTTISIEDLPAGMYIIKVFENGKVITKTFTKN